MNRVILAGRLTKEPELKTTGTGIEVVSFTVAINRSYTNDDGTREADFIDCQAWRQKAAFLCKYFNKGDGVVLSGKLQTRTYQDKNGNNRKATEVVVDEIEFPQGKVGDRSGNSSYNTNASYTTAPPPQQAAQQLPDTGYTEVELPLDDDLPF